jgi:hypothetical protein
MLSAFRRWYWAGLLAALLSPATAHAIAIINGDFEFDAPVTSPPTGWVTSVGTMYVTFGSDGDPTSAFSGSRFVSANRQAPNPDGVFPAAQSMGIFQTVDVSAYASAIDLGNRYAQLNFAYNAGDAGDAGTVAMRFLDGAASLLGSDVTFSTTSRPTGAGEWATSSLLSTVPVGTRSIRFSLLAERIGGSGTVRNVSYDALVAQLLDAPPPLPSRDIVHGNLIQFVDNGAWSWFQDERAIVDQKKGSIIVGSMANRDGLGGEARDGHVQTTHFDLATGSRTLYVHNDLESYGAGDDHNVPGLLKKSDGNILAFYAAHNRLVNTEDDRSYRRTFNVETETWGAESEYHWWDVIPANAPGEGGTTYSNVFQLAAEDPNGDGHGRLYNIARTLQSPHIMFSDDNGVTWQYGGQLSKQNATPPTGSNYVNGYYKYVSNGVDRIDMIATEYHPADYNNSIYHAYIQNGKLYDSSGNEIDDDIFDAATSFDPNAVTSTDDYTRIFQSGAATNTRAWTTDIQSYDDGTIVALFKARAGTSAGDHRAWYGRFDPDAGQWSTHEVARAGANLFSSETDYTGLGAIHPHDPNTLYISTEIDPVTNASLPHHEIYKGVTADKGATWTWTAITENSSFDNLRPIIPAWDENNTAVLWWRGTMDTSHDYDTAVVGILDRRGEDIGKISYVDADSINTTLANGSALSFSGPTGGAGPADGAWHLRTGVGNSGVISADESGVENAPLIKTTAADLQPGVYDVFAFFWANPSADWQISAGLSQDDLMLFRIRSSQQALPEHFLTPIDVSSASAALYRAYLGRKVVGDGGEIEVFVDDSAGGASQQAWFDGIGYAAVDASLAGDFNADGRVDQHDLAGTLGWKARYGVDLDGDDFLTWQRNLGATLSPSAAGLTIPEPHSLYVAMTTAVLMMVFQHDRRLFVWKRAVARTGALRDEIGSGIVDG